MEGQREVIKQRNATSSPHCTPSVTELNGTYDVASVIYVPHQWRRPGCPSLGWRTLADPCGTDKQMTRRCVMGCHVTQ